MWKSILFSQKLLFSQKWLLFHYLIGAAHGIKNFPDWAINGLKEKDEILTTASKLSTASKI